MSFFTQEALQAYQRATELDPDNADGWNNLGLLLSRVGKLDDINPAKNKEQVILVNRKNIPRIVDNTNSQYSIGILQGSRSPKTNYFGESLKPIISTTTNAKMQPSTIAKIYNIERAAHQKIDARYYRKGECDKAHWCNIRDEGEYLKAKDLLITEDICRIDLAFLDNNQKYN